KGIPRTQLVYPPSKVFSDRIRKEGENIDDIRVFINGRMNKHNEESAYSLIEQYHNIDTTMLLYVDPNLQRIRSTSRTISMSAGMSLLNKALEPEGKSEVEMDPYYFSSDILPEPWLKSNIMTYWGVPGSLFSSLPVASVDTVE